MPVADYQTYCTMLERTRTRKFAYPAGRSTLFSSHMFDGSGPPLKDNLTSS